MKIILKADNDFVKEDFEVEFSNEDFDNVNYVEMFAKIGEERVEICFLVEDLLDMAVAFDNKRQRRLADDESDSIGG